MKPAKREDAGISFKKDAKFGETFNDRAPVVPIDESYTDFDREASARNHEP